MNPKKQVTWPDDFPHDELDTIIVGIAEAEQLYRRRRELVKQLIAVRGNTNSAIARSLDITPQAVGLIRKAVKRGET